MSEERYRGAVAKARAVYDDDAARATKKCSDKVAELEKARAGALAILEQQQATDRLKVNVHYDRLVGMETKGRDDVLARAKTFYDEAVVRARGEYEAELMEAEWRRTGKRQLLEGYKPPA